jgi:hypothetical protein
MLTPLENDLRDASVLIGLLALLIFASPLLSWWLRDENPWYLLYLLWACVIALGALIHARPGTDR